MCDFQTGSMYSLYKTYNVLHVKITGEPSSVYKMASCALLGTHGQQHVVAFDTGKVKYIQIDIWNCMKIEHVEYMSYAQQEIIAYHESVVELKIAGDVSVWPITAFTIMSNQ